MLPAPYLNLFDIRFAMEVARVLPAPFPLTRQLAGNLAFRPAAKSLVITIPRMRSEPSPTVTTLSESIRAHRFLPFESREEYNKQLHTDRPFKRHVGCTDLSPGRGEEGRR
jgi:hypothetical protein